MLEAIYWARQIQGGLKADSVRRPPVTFCPQDKTKPQTSRIWKPSRSGLVVKQSPSRVTMPAAFYVDTPPSSTTLMLPLPLFLFPGSRVILPRWRRPSGLGWYEWGRIRYHGEGSRKSHRRWRTMPPNDFLLLTTQRLVDCRTNGYSRALPYRGWSATARGQGARAYSGTPTLLVTEGSYSTVRGLALHYRRSKTYRDRGITRPSLSVDELGQGEHCLACCGLPRPRGPPIPAPP
ncbi:hypothetical protein VTK56DRAFT_476 [Thermocarpiscus australiensis]